MKANKANEEASYRNEWIKALLDNPAHNDNPLRPALALLYSREQKSQTKLKRLIEIADGYGNLQLESLVANYEKQCKRLEKISRISDRYQETMRELNEQLRQASLFDPLTGLGNRRLFLPRLKEEQTRSQRHTSPYCLAMLDIDYFKRFNDHYGHEVGDMVLCRIAKAISSSLRYYDVCARWGGEEFIVLLPDTPLGMAISVAERMREAAVATSLADIDDDISLTISIGVTAFHVGEDYNETINRADAALLTAKRSGRNRVEVIE